MGKQNWKPGNMLNPVPAVMVSVADKAGKANIITVAGNQCHHILHELGYNYNELTIVRRTQNKHSKVL